MFVLVENCTQALGSSDVQVPLVPDQCAVEELGGGRSAPTVTATAFILGIRIPVNTVRIPASAGTASNSSGNLTSRSRIRAAGALQIHDQVPGRLPAPQLIKPALSPSPARTWLRKRAGEAPLADAAVEGSDPGDLAPDTHVPGSRVRFVQFDGAEHL
ncbi:hypothetical protein [Actinomadura sp. B10D3]|uniref:hypothetical protein n=1 Tax=Actinomadura sp. B10D3 TaxID=3153557 RepID=UPI00325D8180